MYKQIIIARKDLGLSHGKLATQVAHASLAPFMKMIRDNMVGEVVGEDKYRINTFDIDKGLYEEWIEGIFTKIVLQAKNKNALLRARDMAIELGMKENEDFFLIADCCKTELEPEFIDENGVGRTYTCIGFRPMPAEEIDPIARKYHIYTEA